jgi:2,5-dihydroxypyridine 5,6-dioxygenase
VQWPGTPLFSTGANECAGRYTTGHSDIPVMKTTIRLDNSRPAVVDGSVMDLA